MRQANRLRARSADQPWTDRIWRATAWTAALLASLTTLGAPTIASAQVKYRSDCQVVDTNRLESFGHDGRPAQLSHFTCRITGGPLHGSSVTGTNIWDLSEGETAGMLLGSIAIAQRAGMNVMYEVHDVTRHTQIRDGKAVGWTASSWGIYKSATGSAAYLAGKTFTSAVHYTGPGTFVIDNIIGED